MSFVLNENPDSPIVCTIPHAGTEVPEAVRNVFRLDSLALAHEIAFMADGHTDKLYEELLPFTSSIIATVSRVVVDVERFEHEPDEPMSAVGMSAFYTRTSTGAPLRTLTPESRAPLVALYRNYHRALASMTSAALDRHGKALIVDCHSFPAVPRAYESDQKTPRPDVCIGSDDYHTPPSLRDILEKNFRELGFSVGINTPFAGSIVPLPYYQKEPRVVSVMIEINRRLYMDETTFQRLPDFFTTGRSISRCVIKSLNQFTV
jgi:N-formylglutamate amidohydrolase